MFKHNFIIVVSMLGMLIALPVKAQLDDPTRPPGFRLVLPSGAKKSTASFSVSSIYISASQRVAVINGQRVKQGGSINGAKVIAIQPTSVTLNRAGKSFRIKLLSGVVKKTLSRKGSTQ